MKPLFKHRTLQTVCDLPFDAQQIEQIHEVIDPVSGQTDQYSLRVSYHSQKRSQQRGIRPEDIAMAMTYGHLIQKQRLCYYIVKMNDLPEELSPSVRQRLKNLVVITNVDTDCLITCYKNAGGLRHIKKKHPQLMRMAS